MLSSTQALGPVTTAVVNLPSGAQAGDLLVCFVGKSGSVAGTQLTNKPAWLQEVVNAPETNGRLIALRGAIPDPAPENISLTFSGSDHVAAISYAIPFVDYAVATHSIVPRTNTPLPALVSPSGARGYTYLACRMVPADSDQATAAPSGFSNLLTITSYIPMAAADSVGMSDTFPVAAWGSPGSFTCISAAVMVYECPRLVGQVTGQTGFPAQRVVRPYIRSTGQLVSLAYGEQQDFTSKEDGSYSLKCPSAVEHYVVALPDATSLPALIADRKVPS